MTKAAATPPIAQTSASIDPTEIAKFASLAAQWWAPDGAFAALHRMNPARLAFIRDRAISHFALAPNGRKPLAGLTALDVGCGGGLVTLPLARMGATTTGIDAGQDAVGAARIQANATETQGVLFEQTSAEEIAKIGRMFDLVVALEILEHVRDPCAFLETLGTLVRPGGLLVVSTINRTAMSRVFAITAAEKLLKWAPEGAHDYDKLIKPSEITAALPHFKWDAPIGLSFKLSDRTWQASGDISMNYMMAATRPA
ncbi:MAG: bifunctional 2-polyprenyl-6-hydroxyphenol methylase/3-demethylubiquinol 3-O-methyltransferase UbiG [Caulobacterales bacterium]